MEEGKPIIMEIPEERIRRAVGIELHLFRA
jgi:hypothetical protein